MYNAEIIPEHVHLLFFTMKVTFENKGPVFKQMWSLPVGHRTHGTFGFGRTIPTESDHVLTRNQDISTPRRKAVGEGSKEPCTGSRASGHRRARTSSAWGQEPASRLMSHPQRASKSRTRPRQGSAWFASFLPATEKAAWPHHFLLLQGSGARWTREFRNSNHLPLKDNYFTLILWSRLPGSPFLFFFPSAFFFS